MTTKAEKDGVGRTACRKGRVLTGWPNDQRSEKNSNGQEEQSRQQQQQQPRAAAAVLPEPKGALPPGEAVRILADQTPASAVERLLAYLHETWVAGGRRIKQDLPGVDSTMLLQFGFPDALIRTWETKKRKRRARTAGLIVGGDNRWDREVTGRRLLEGIAAAGDVATSPSEQDADLLRRLRAELGLSWGDDGDAIGAAGGDDSMRLFRVFRSKPQKSSATVS